MFTRKLAAPLLFSMTAMSFPSHALLLDFIDMADSSLSQGTNIGTIGERGFSSGMDSSNTGAFSSLFSELGLTITATKNMVSASPYLDQGTAGLGVCGSLNFNFQCNPSSDDNIAAGANEYLTFSFSKDVVINNVWLNNNHDGNFSDGDNLGLLSDSISTFSASPTLTSASHGNLIGQQLFDDESFDATNGIFSVFSLGSLYISAGDSFQLGYPNGCSLQDCPQYYVAAMDVALVPEPESLAVFALGLLGLAAVRRRKV